MGRIADALKKAEQQRQAQLAASGQATAVAEPDSPGATPSEDRERTPDVVPATAPGPIQRVEGMSESLVSYYEPSGMIAEQYRGLRTRLLSQNPDNEHRTIGITSGLPRDGKSVTALNLAFILSEIRHLKVLVVDGDFRRGSLAQMQNMTSSPGLADVLRGTATYEEVIQPTVLPNLFFVSAGKTDGRSAAEVLSSDQAGSVFERFRTEFHYCIVDTPPATTVTDVGIIGQYCNGIIMVVRLHSTPEPAAKRAVRVLQANNIPIIGTVLVGNEAQGCGYYGYYRYYNNYYRYYYRSKDETDGRKRR